MLVRLLLGEVPAHEDFQGPGVQRSLAPYFRLTQAVRLGDLTAFRYGCPQRPAWCVALRPAHGARSSPCTCIAGGAPPSTLHAWGVGGLGCQDSMHPTCRPGTARHAAACSSCWQEVIAG